MALTDQPCAYCGTSEHQRTKGHVISRRLYPDTLSDAKRIVVPECIECKAIWEDAEPHFRNVMLAIWDPDKVVSDDRFASMQRSFQKCDGLRRLKDLYSLIVPSKECEGRKLLYPAEDPTCNLILRRIVRGLCYHHDFDPPIDDDRVVCNVMEYSVPEAFQPDFTWHEIAPDFFRYAYVYFGEDDVHSGWLLRFSKHIEFLGTVLGAHDTAAKPTNVA